MNTHEKRFLVYNVTDGNMAHPHLMTLSEARSFIQHFPERFARQGYYLTWSRERIRPDEVELEIVDTGADPPLSINSQAQPTHRGW